MTNFQLTILFIVIAVLCCILHFVLGTLTLSIAGATLFGVWSGAGAWCSYVGLVNLCAFWMSCIQLSRLFDENTANGRVDSSLQDFKTGVDAVNAINNS